MIRMWNLIGSFKIPWFFCHTSMVTLWKRLKNISQKNLSKLQKNFSINRHLEKLFIRIFHPCCNSPNIEHTRVRISAIQPNPINDRPNVHFADPGDLPLQMVAVDPGTPGRGNIQLSSMSEYIVQEEWRLCKKNRHFCQKNIAIYSYSYTKSLKSLTGEHKLFLLIFIKTFIPTLFRERNPLKESLHNLFDFSNIPSVF